MHQILDNEKIRFIRKALNLSQTGFAKGLGISQAALSDIEKGKNNFSFSVYKALVMNYKVNPVWILNGKGDVFYNINNYTTENYNQSYNQSYNLSKTDLSANNNSKDSRIKHKPDNNDNQHTKLDIINLIDLINGQYKNLSYSEYLTFPNNFFKYSDEHVCIIIKGESMSPTIQSGEYGVFRKLSFTDNTDIKSGHIHIILTNYGEVSLKRIKILDDIEKIELSSDYPDKSLYPPYEVSLSDIVSIWQLEWHLSNKTINHNEYISENIKRLGEEIEIIKKKLIL